LEPLFTELDSSPGDGARLVGIKALRDELATRRARVDEEERFYRANTERTRRLALGTALGPGSGLAGEVVALDFAALERRLDALAPELGELGACAHLQSEFTGARAAVTALAQAFAAGEFRRKSVADPRTKKLRELREVRETGLVFEKDGALELVSWREARGDAEWFRQLFDGRLTREWNAAEARGVAALLRCVARAAELAREMLDGGGRGFLQPAELAALETGFAQAATWCADAKLADESEACAREASAGAALSVALAAAQERAFTRAVFQLETLLAEGEGTTLVALLSSGADWRRAAR
ncbi:MAG: hypothetical protein ABL952_17645, partial [Pyrinomonadaceae bacterium]